MKTIPTNLDERYIADSQDFTCNVFQWVRSLVDFGGKPVLTECPVPQEIQMRPPKNK